MSRVKTSRHTLKFSNSGKINGLGGFIDEYRRCLSHFVDYLWDKGYKFEKGGKVVELDIKRGLLNCPKMVSSSIVQESNLTSFLSGRALKCCMTQAAGMVSASIEKQRKRLYMLEKLKKEAGEGCRKKRKLLVRKIKQNVPQKPNCSNASVELNSICAKFHPVETGEFNGFLLIKSITKDKLEINLPVKFTRHSLKLQKSGGHMMNSFLIGEDKIDLRWALSETMEKSEGVTLGADQGMNDVLTISDGTVTKKSCNHGHTLSSILDKVSRKKKGSRAFKRAKLHQKNFVNWSINQLDFSNIKALNLEKIWNIGFRRKTSRKLSHWQNTLIRNKIRSKCEDEGVKFALQSCTYRSQRCSACGNVRKANRKAKVYSCKRCGNTLDSDLNAAKNHEETLPEIPYTLRNLNLNRGDGFLWNQLGFFDLEGRSLQSLPHVEK